MLKLLPMSLHSGAQPRSTHTAPTRMRHEIVGDVERLERCRSEYVARSGRETTLDYLRAARCRAFYRGDDLVAFYAVNVAAPSALRYAQWLPPHERWRLSSQKETPCAELSCVFIGPDASWAQVYLQAMADLRSSRALMAVAGSVIPRVVPVYRGVFPLEVYSGPASFGLDCWIGMGPVEDLLLRAAMLIPGHAVRKWMKRYRSAR